MIHTIIWSKDRPAQLDLTLQTYKKYVLEWRKLGVSIIYKVTNDGFTKGYDLVKSYHPEFNWIAEKDFKKDTVDAYFNNDKNYVSFLVDDDIFVDHFSIESKEMKHFIENEDIACLSSRLSPNVNFCYTQNKPQLPPEFIKDDIYKWEINKGIFDWGYPMSVAAFHIFRKEDVSYIKDINFRAPNTLEATLDNHRIKNKNLMICFSKAKCITSTNNRVQVENNNRHDNLQSVISLNEEFIKGSRLNVDVNDNKILNMCHGPMTLEWKKYV